MFHILIPARKNSKGIKNKNIVKLKDKELIYYTIQTAKKVKLASEIIVSTDSKKIANISKKYGASVPFLRPKKFSGDNSPDIDVFKHYISWLRNKKKKIPDYIIHLRATTPFRSHKVINKAIDLIKSDKSISSLRSMRQSIFTPFKMWTIKNKFCVPLMKNKIEKHSLSRQSLQKTYDHISYVDILYIKKTILKNSMTGKKVYPFILDDDKLKYFVDIDDKNDLNSALKFLKK
ncbi:acylneuraminate cytidylyltransferase family protein [Candidatus Pelagibacter bacterium nBUS_44]|uniref:acylneuraminate cytidylyltransferase family protein n=1 Tax=Candidatus Pelagibacter bacterium nBUS_44 TaxID=3374195 RepID=UPI003EBE91B8